MPILIAHRGNIEGPNLEQENHPDYIQDTLSVGFDVEIDVWCLSGHFFLGHDSPTHETEEDFLVDSRLWCHAKDLRAFERMLKNPFIHCFWHQEDDFTLTSRGYIWTYPGKPLGNSSICVLPETQEQASLPAVAGICSDFIGRYKESEERWVRT